MTTKPTLSRNRIFILGGIFILLYIILIVRLGDIQLESSNKYKKKIAIQSIRRVRIPATRGRIFSSDGKVLADNKPCFNIIFHLAEMRKRGRRSKTVNYIYDSAKKIAEAINRKPDISKKDIISQMNMRPAIPITVVSDLNKKELALAYEYTPHIPGMEIIVIPTRYYPYKRTACHILGYTGKDDPSEAPDRLNYSYYIPDIKGRSGLEKAIDTKINLGATYNGLRGKPGNNLLQVNVKGYVHDDIGISRDPVNGNNVTLTVNLKAQLIAEKVLDGKKGSFVLMDANSGAVLAIVSSPGYDLNLFTDGISRSMWKTLLQDPEKPLFDRALMGQYMPGSIVKPLVSLAALKEGINPFGTIYCGGSARIGNTKINCWIWKYGGHGNENMMDAIRDSCNVYFVKTGLSLGLENIAAIYKAAGLGRKTNIGLPERSGQLPSRERKKKQSKRSWSAFDTALISIGQGMLTLTPIQAATFTAAIANGGTMWQPYLIKDIYNYNDKLIYSAIPNKVEKLPVSQKMLYVVKEGMFESVHDENGSSKRANNHIISLYGKTGTAQVGPKNKRRRNTWFIGFGKFKDKLYSIAVAVEDGKAGGLTNAPMVKQFFTEWLPTL